MISLFFCNFHLTLTTSAIMDTILKRALFPLFVLLLVYGCRERQQKGTPEAYGFSSDTLYAASALMQEYIDDGKLPCISTLVMKNGDIVHRGVHGYADVVKQVPLEEHQLFRIFSLGKPVTAVALMMLYEEGLFALDDPVAEYIPEFAETEVYLTDTDPPVLIPQNDQITIRHLLTHTSGLTYGWDPYNYVDSLYGAMIPPLWEVSSLSVFSEKLARLPLKYQPGSRWEYSVSLDIASYLVEILSGMTFKDFLETRVLRPLQMNDTGFQVPDSALHRLAMIYIWDYDQKELEPMPAWVEQVKHPVTLFSGGRGLVSSIEDYARFGQMLLNGGELEGLRLLKRETIDMIMSDQLPEGIVFREGVGYGLGGSVELETGVYHWYGMASTFFWADPGNDLLILCFSQFIPAEKYAFGREFREKVMAALDAGPVLK